MSNINGYAQDSITLNGIVTDDYTTSIIDLTGDNISLTSTTLLYNGLPLVTSAGIETLNSKTQNITASPNQTQIVGNLNVDTIKTDSISDVLSSSSIQLTVGGVNITSDALNFNGESVITATGNSTQYIMGDGSLLQYSANSGNSNFYLYKSHTNTPGAPPDDGFVVYNNSNQSLATIIYISHRTDDAIDIEVFFNNISQLNDVYIQDKNISGNYIRYNITASPTIIVGSYISIPVSRITSGGSGSTSFGANHPILLSFFTNTIETDARLTSLESKTQYQTGLGGNITGFTGELLVSGETMSGTFRKTGGLSTEFLKANGTVDTISYSYRKFSKIGVYALVPLNTGNTNLIPTVNGLTTFLANEAKAGDVYTLTIRGTYSTTAGAQVIRITVSGFNNQFGIGGTVPFPSNLVGSFYFTMTVHYTFLSTTSATQIVELLAGGTSNSVTTNFNSGYAANGNSSCNLSNASTFTVTAASSVASGNSIGIYCAYLTKN